MIRILHWRDIAPAGEAFHAARAAWTHRNQLYFHGHDFTEVFWIDAGLATHNINGAAVSLRPGNMVAIRREDCHSIEPLPGEVLRLTNIAFPWETVDFLRQRYFTAAAPTLWRDGKLPFSFQAEPAQIALFNHWADTLSQAPRERLHIERFLLNLLCI